MENVLIYALILSSLSAATVNGIKAHKLTNLFESFDLNLLNDAVDLQISFNEYQGDQVVIDTYKFEQNVLQYIQYNLKDYQGKIKVVFGYFNVENECDCIRYDYPCNGVSVKIISDLSYLFTERRYNFEIIHT